MSSWRVLAQRATTRQWLHMDLPLTPTTRRWELSASGALSGTVAAQVGGMLAEDGKPLLDEWGTLIYLEADGIIRWGGIVVSSRFTGSAWTVEAAGFAAYPHGVPFGDEWSLAQVDPAKIVADLWAHVQSYPDGDLGVTVTGSTSVRVGTVSTAALIAATAAWQSAKDAYDAANTILTGRRATETARRTEYTALVADRTAASAALAAAKRTGNSAAIAAAQATYNAAVAAATAKQAQVTAAANARKAQADVVAPLKATLTARAKARTAAKAAEKEDGGAYELAWWDTPDCGNEIDRLSRETPFDFVESHRWNDDRTDVLHTIEVHYPRAGRRRTDLSFVLGENIVGFADPQRDGDKFANEIEGVGAGEGAGSLRRTTAVRDGRLRRPHVLLAKDVAKKDRLDALIRDERIRRTQPLVITTITVRNHPHAPIGSWALGDDIRVQVTNPWLGNVDIWHRVVGWELVTESTARLSLERSDSFIYSA